MQGPLALVVLMVFASVAGGCLHIGEPSTTAHDFLRDAKYTRMMVEVDYQEGNAPLQSALDLLETRIKERCRKPGGVQFQQAMITDAKSRWTAQDLRDLEEKQRDHRTGGDTAVLYVLYVGGRYEKDTDSSRVLGVQYGPSSIALFKDNIRFASTAAGLPLPFTQSDVERSVLIHEFGHALGLVNNGIPMVRDREHAEHPGHSTNKGSVMYWAVESSVIRQVFDGPPPTQFDADDIADLQRAGGK